MVRKTRDGAADTAVIEQEDGTVRAAVSGEEVRQHHQEVAEDWTGRSKERWFYTQEGSGDGARSRHDSGYRNRFWQGGDEGAEAQRRLADGDLTAEDIDSVPPSLRKVLPHLRKVHSPAAG